MSRKNRKKSKKTGQNFDKIDTKTPAKPDVVFYRGTKEAMLNALHESGGIVTDAAIAAGIDRTTHYVWMKNDPVYAEAVSEISEITLDEAEKTLLSLMRYSEHDPTRMNSARAILQARGKSRGYGTENRKVEHSGEINTTARVEIVARLPDNGRGPVGELPANSI